ncbi:hypothetical protein BKA64DRAFT_663981 [Cadophora sp. MPI-SDFR-AT-0126]|nr:hypothetical protein BKA64DRAFT_663981 [Leotiomycetes sp. MPI-SDFR-AT-0126]
MAPNHPIGFVPSFSLVVRHIVFRFGTLILKILSVMLSVLLRTLFYIGFAFSKLAREISSISWPTFFATIEKNTRNSHKDREIAEQNQRRTGVESGAGGRNGVPEGWVRYVICRTEDISEFDLDSCEGCRQVLETEIEMASGEDELPEELAEKLKGVESWLEEIEKLDRDSGYSSPDADGETGQEILWGSPNC